MVFHQTRREIMQSIRGKGNKTTELKLLSLFKEHKLTGWRRHQPLPGKPDFAFPMEKLAVFVDGCFWHGCPSCYQAPKKNKKFWRDKVEGNQRRDRRVTRQLRSEGWSVCRIWECRLKKPDSVIRRIRRMLG
ncbi:MAG: very short patch repair endonuclease [Planctomycetota bacterium]|nr:very short patch repair endonuclease [Planctomycetota bacterium]